MHLDPPNRRVVDDQGAEYTYDQLLLATGGTPRRLPSGGDHILYFRTLQDYLALRSLTERGRRFVNLPRKSRHLDLTREEVSDAKSGAEEN